MRKREIRDVGVAEERNQGGREKGKTKRRGGASNKGQKGKETRREETGRPSEREEEREKEKEEGGAR